MLPTPTLLTAAHHPDPYPFYAQLRAEHPSGLHHDAALKLWVASSAEAVEEVLSHPALRVRPPGEPVPRALLGTTAGSLFGGLMRQNDGATHERGKSWAVSLLQGRPWAVMDAARAVATAGASPQRQPLDTLLFEAPVRVLWQLLQGGDDDAGTLPQKVRAVIAAWSPTADDTTRQLGSEAAAALLARLDGDANRVGLYTQTCEASAGLMGAVLVALQHEPGLRERWLDDPTLDDALAAEVARHDPPVQNTRRFAAEPCLVRGATLQPNDAILVLLASANRDSRLTPDADRFELHRRDARNFTWGHGAHACPGAALSRQIVMSLLRAWHVHDAGTMAGLTRRWQYRASPNGRLARFDPP